MIYLKNDPTKALKYSEDKMYSGRMRTHSIAAP